jgi:hypothetical protein
VTGPTGPTGPNPIVNEVNDGNTGTAITINFTTGPNHVVTVTGACTFTFTAPSNSRHVQVRLVYGGAGGYALTWPAAVKWAGGAQPSWVTTVGAVNIASFFYDGTNYWGAGTTGFA